MKAPHDASELDASQQRALAALLTTETIAAAAKAANLSEATLYRYLRDDHFKSAYRQARSEIVEHAVAQMQRDCAAASKALREVCEDPKAPASARVSAARVILEGSLKAVEIGDLSAKIAALQKLLDQEREG